MPERKFDRVQIWKAAQIARQLADFVRPGPGREREAAEAIDLLCDFAIARADREIRRQDHA